MMTLSIASSLLFLPQTFAERVLNTAPAGLLLAGMVWALLRVTGGANSGTRFAIWFSSLLAVAVLPFVPGSIVSHTLHFSGAPHSAVILSTSWAAYLFAGWALIASLLLLRLGTGIWRVRSLRANCREVNLAALDPKIAKVFGALAKRRRVSLCTSKELSVPAAIGLFRPAIVFPESLFAQLSTGELEMIVRHEMAHLERRDDWTNLIQKLVKAVFFFHPAVWWIENRLTLEREMACDDIVLEQTQSRHAYASSLISFAEKLHSARALALAQSLVSRAHQMAARVEQILDATRPVGTRVWKPAMALSGGLLLLVFGASSYTPRLVTFQPDPHGVLRAQANPEFESALDGIQMSHARAVPVLLRQPLLRNAVPKVKAIPAGFHQRTANLQSSQTMAHKPLPARKPLMVRASVEQQPSLQETIFIVQTAEYGGASANQPQVWTLCIWRVSAENAKQIESAVGANKL